MQAHKRGFNETSLVAMFPSTYSWHETDGEPVRHVPSRRRTLLAVTLLKPWGEIPPASLRLHTSPEFLASEGILRSYCSDACLFTHVWQAGSCPHSIVAGFSATFSLMGRFRRQR